MINFIFSILKNNKSPFWQIARKFFYRGILGVKFIVCARILGPQEFGIATVGLTILAILEGLTELGYDKALIQSRSTPNEIVNGGIFLFKLFRSLIICLILFFSASLVSKVFNIQDDQVMNIIRASSFIPLVKSLVNPGYVFLDRNLNFRSAAIVDLSSACFDLVIVLLLFKLGVGPISIIFSSISAEFLRVVLSWVFFKIEMGLNHSLKMFLYSTRLIRSFGKWIWGISVLSVLNNQFDRLVISNSIGVTNYGAYNTTSRIAQFIVADIPSSYSTYLFSKFSNENRKNKDIYSIFKFKVINFIKYGFVPLIFLVFISEYILLILLGEEWLIYTNLFRVQLISMFTGSVISFFVSYYNSISKPKVIFKSVLIGFLIFLSLIFFSIKQGVIGVALTFQFSLIATLTILILSLKKNVLHT